MSGLLIILLLCSALYVAALVSQKAEDTNSGLWVCDPTIRHLLENAPVSVSRGEVLGRCHQMYTKEACNAAQMALFRGSDVLTNLDLLCGPLPPAAQLENAGIVGAGAYKGGYSGGVGFGPLGEGVKVPGANGEPHTSFRGPIAPPLTNAVELDKTTKQKKAFPQKFSWEKSSRANSTSIDQAAEAVRVFDAAGLGGGSGMQGASRYPLTSMTRESQVTDEVSAPNFSSNISMNVTPWEPVSGTVPPMSDTEAVQAAGNAVGFAPYAYAPYAGDWGNDSYWQLNGPTASILDACGLTLVKQLSSDGCYVGTGYGCKSATEMYADEGCRGEFSCAGQSVTCQDFDEESDDDIQICPCDGLTLASVRQHSRDLEDDDAEVFKQERTHHKRKSKRSDDRGDDKPILSAMKAEDGLLLRAAAHFPTNMDTKAAVAQTESGKLLGMKVAAQRR